MIDRLAIRQRPPGWPMMHQTWDKLLFLHWPIPAEHLRPLVPARLQIDTWEGMAWIAITPLVVRGLRPPLLPALPVVSRTLEINVRTYVHLDGVPGVWFFSLDAANPLAVWGARIGFSLPYLRASMRKKEQEGRIEFTSRRTNAGAPPAVLSAAWTRGARLPEVLPQSREFFLIERYCLYAENASGLYRARIHHRPWPLCSAALLRWESTMIESLGLPTPGHSPLLHALAEPLHVEVWPPQRV
jgi:uncharacterized protein YqjF (DUF2071 family)